MVQLRLMVKMLECETREGTFIVLRALFLSLVHWRYTTNQLIRLAYWGTPGTSDD